MAESGLIETEAVTQTRPDFAARVRSASIIGVALVGALLQFAWLVALLGVGAGGLATHIYRCFINEDWWFLAVGTAIFPVGIVHGAGIWLGSW